MLNNSHVAFNGEVTHGDFSRVQSLLMPFWARAYVVVPACILLFVSLGVGWSAVIDDPMAALTDLLIGLIVLLASAVMVWFGRRRAWRSYTRVHGKVFGQLTAEGLEWNTAVTAAKFPWDKLLRFRERDGLVLVYYEPRIAFFFPRSFFATDADWQAFRGQLAARLVGAGQAGPTRP